MTFFSNPEQQKEKKYCCTMKQSVDDSTNTFDVSSDI